MRDLCMICYTILKLVTDIRVGNFLGTDVGAARFSDTLLLSIGNGTRAQIYPNNRNPSFFRHLRFGRDNFESPYAKI